MNFKLSPIVVFCVFRCILTQRIESIFENDLTTIFQQKKYFDANHLSGYTPDFFEVRGSIFNIDLHGIYKRVQSLDMSKETVPWYTEDATRPVYMKLSAKEKFYLYWSSHPTDQWRISTQYPIQDPNTIDAKIIKAIVPSLSYLPGFTKGWYVVPSEDADKKQIEFTAISTERRRKPKRNGIPLEFFWDQNILVDEARPYTYSDCQNDDREPGCPKSSDGQGLHGVIGYKVDPCFPPTAETSSLNLEFTMTGADGQLGQALFTWEGYFQSRPYFVLRGPLASNLPHGHVELNGRIQYVWAEGSIGTIPTWYISRELGNKHISQLFARWTSRDQSYHQISGADWPAQTGLELIPDRWVIFKRPIKLSHLIGTREDNLKEIKSMIQTKAVLPTDRKIIIKNLQSDLDGDYQFMGDYLGYPYYRHFENGFVIYRGHVISSELDCWVIGSSLGSKEGLKAYSNDDNARWPHMITMSWWIWNLTNYTWTRNSNVEIRIGFNKADVVPAIETSIFPRCPLPTCHRSSFALCPSTGTCDECRCQPRQRSSIDDLRMRKETDSTDFLSDTLLPLPIEVFQKGLSRCL